jgi:Fe-S cluster biogenesis protein NfuA
MTENRREFTRRSERIEELVSRIENCGDLASRAVAKELLQAVLELHAAALERILDAVHAAEGGEAVLHEITADALVSGVLSLHGIHPVAVEDRVAAAIETARPYLASHGGNVELDSIKEGVVHVRLEGSCGCCSSSAETLKNAVEDAVLNAAPEIAAVVAEPAPAQPHSELVILRAS